MFSSEPERVGGEFPHPKSIKDIEENHPQYYLGMFQKLINNHLNYQKGLIEMFKTADPNLNMKEIEAAGEHLLYKSAWEYIKKFDLEDSYSQEILEKSNLKDLKKAIKSSLIYYENEEEYEKCAFLKKLLDFSNSRS